MNADWFIFSFALFAFVREIRGQAFLIRAHQRKSAAIGPVTVKCFHSFSRRKMLKRSGLGHFF
jgi:hypothetical protein